MLIFYKSPWLVVNYDGKSMSAVDVTTEIVIRAPLKKVAEFASNPDNAPLWYVNIKSVVWKTRPPLQIGSEIAFKAQFLGRQLSYIYKIVECVAGEKLVMRTLDGPFPMETTYTWHAIDDDKTYMKLRSKGIPSGFSKLFTPFMSLMIRKANKKDLLRLKVLLEGGNP